MASFSGVAGLGGGDFDDRFGGIERCVQIAQKLVVKQCAVFGDDEERFGKLPAEFAGGEAYAVVIPERFALVDPELPFGQFRIVMFVGGDDERFGDTAERIEGEEGVYLGQLDEQFLIDERRGDDQLCCAVLAADAEALFGRVFEFYALGGIARIEGDVVELYGGRVVANLQNRLLGWTVGADDAFCVLAGDVRVAALLRFFSLFSAL